MSDLFSDMWYLSPLSIEMFIIKWFYSINNHASDTQLFSSIVSSQYIIFIYYKEQTWFFFIFLKGHLE